MAAVRSGGVIFHHRQPTAASHRASRWSPASRRARRSAPAVLLLAVLGTACGSDSQSRSAAPAGDLTIVAKDYKYQPDTLKAPVGKDLVVVVDNQDRRVGHNIHFTTLPGRPLTPIEPGPRYQTLKVRFDQPGKYAFICDIHPTMTGTVEAS
jgi:plastocyanin